MATDYKTTKELLLATPLPVQTSTYKPVSHAQLIDLTLGGIQKAGFTLDKELYSSSSDGEIAHATYRIGNVSDKEMQMMVTWQNSYNKQLKLAFAVGAKVLVCLNGMISFRSMSSFNRKHTGEIQIFAPGRISEYIQQAAEVFVTLQQDRDQMKQVLVDRRLAAELIGRMYIEEGFIESTQLNIIKRELDKPTFDYNAAGSLWELYNHTTFAIGGIHPSHWLEDHIAAHKFFVEASGILTPDRTSLILPEIKEEDKLQLKLFDEL
jgi:hypothetical protein